MAKKQVTNSGTIQVHKKVLKEIAYTSVLEIDGVTFADKSFIMKFLGIIGVGKYSGVVVRTSGKNDVSFEVKIYVRYGLNIPITAKKVQDALRATLEKTVQINLKDIDINVQGIER